MADIYACFSELAASEGRTAYSIALHDRGTAVAVVAPHGGGIEPGTSEVAVAIAGEEYSLYLFEGLKARANAQLHITSTRFDEPSCISLLSATQIALTVHGEDSAPETVYIGGAHAKAISAIRAALESSGFTVREHHKVSLSGRDLRNICNRGASGAGVQLELSSGLRSTLFRSLTRLGRQQPTARLAQLSTAIRQVLPEIGL